MCAAADNDLPLKNSGLETTDSLSSSAKYFPSSSTDFPRSSDESASQGSTTLPSESSSPSEENSLFCWSCTSASQGNPCTNIDPLNTTAVDSKVCSPEEKFCSVKRIWYVVENKEAVVFSVIRNCSAECDPVCMIIGDRTKIHSCTSCCTESHCNTDNSSSSRQTSNFLLLISALAVAIVPVLSLPAATNTRDGNGYCKSSKKHKHISHPATASSDVFLCSRQKPQQRWRQNLSTAAAGRRRSLLLDRSHPSSILSIPSISVFASVSSKSFDNF